MILTRIIIGGKVNELIKAFAELKTELKTELREVNEELKTELKIELKEVNEELKTELEEEIKVQTQRIPKNVNLLMHSSVFGILERNWGRDKCSPIGVAFFVRPRLAITALHNLEIENEELKINNFFYLRNEAKVEIETRVVLLDRKRDFALLLVASKDVRDLEPFPIIKDAKEALNHECLMLGMNVGPVNSDEAGSGSFGRISYGVSVIQASISRVEGDCVTFCGATFKGDSGSAIVTAKTRIGAVVALHQLQINTAPKTSEEAVKNNEKILTAKKLKTDDDVSSHFSRNGMSAQGFGIRLDVLNREGLFDETYE